MYKLSFNVPDNKLDNGVIRLSDNAFIPFDPANVDYQKYLAWVEAGNTALPADK